MVTTHLIHFHFRGASPGAASQSATYGWAQGAFYGALYGAGVSEAAAPCTSGLVVNGCFETWTDPTYPDNWTKDGTHNLGTDYVEESPADHLHMENQSSNVMIRQNNKSITCCFAL